mmetsp:Transcript_61429/g.109610  ORF Transcript_61429/g.109610 Transcript_61429/m.109610 type:complete len:349 (+) Transcript_61429:113-1159(+)
MEHPSDVRPSTSAGQVALPPSDSCLACAECGQAVATAAALMPEQVRFTLKKAVYAYELGVLGVSTWCYSATGAGQERFDIVRLAEVCIGGARNSLLADRLGTRRATGVVVADVEASPKSENSWFPGFMYQAVRCGGCPGRRLLGWAFTPEDATSAHCAGFFGLIITRLRERPFGCPGWRPSSFAAGGPAIAAATSRGFRPLRGLTAGTVMGTSAPGAAAAARGRGTMPVQLIPSTETSARGPSPFTAIRRLVSRGSAGAVALNAASNQDEADDSGASSDESTDFQLQRQTRRHEAERRMSSSRGPSGPCLRQLHHSSHPSPSRFVPRPPPRQAGRGQGKQFRRRPLIS